MTSEGLRFRRMNRTSLALVVLFLGCVPRVTLPAIPLATAPHAERLSAFEELRPLSAAQTANPANPWLNASQPFLMLNNGVRVMDPNDLLPAVKDASPTAGYVRAYNSAKTGSRIASSVSVGMLLVAAVFDAIALSGLSQSSSVPDRDLRWLLAGTGVTLGALVPLTIAMISEFRARTEETSAYLTYERDLRARLEVPEKLPPLPPSPALLPASP